MQPAGFLSSRALSVSFFQPTRFSSYANEDAQPKIACKHDAANSAGQYRKSAAPHAQAFAYKIPQLLLKMATFQAIAYGDVNVPLGVSLLILPG